MSTATATATETKTATLAPFDVNGCKAYATRANLEKAIAKLGFDTLPRLYVCNEEGKHTAIFLGPNANCVIFQGFKWVFGFDSSKK